MSATFLSVAMTMTNTYQKYILNKSPCRQILIVSVHNTADFQTPQTKQKQPGCISDERQYLTNKGKKNQNLGPLGKEIKVWEGPVMIEIEIGY